MKDLFYLDRGEYDGSISFDDNGCISFSTYSYHISSYGDVELTKDETKKLYEAMKKYYERG